LLSRGIGVATHKLTIGKHEWQTGWSGFLQQAGDDCVLSKFGGLLSQIEAVNAVSLRSEPFKVGGELHQFGVNLWTTDT
jgi:hypothetical protein